ncbi:glycosyltransferase family 39 protein [bacterium]|nr:glycosyltransferase family 39 protein [bacterium]
MNRIVCVGGFSVMTLMLVCFWRYGYIHLDGGYYVSAGYGVAHGHVPYRDFFFPQGPIYPYVYGLFHLLFGSTVQTTRLLSLIWALIIFILLYKHTLHAAGLFAATIATLLLGLNSFIAYFLVVEKLNALSGCLLLAGCILFMRQQNDWRLHIGLTLLSLAVMTRYTLLPVLVPVYLWLIWQNRRTPVIVVRAIFLQCVVMAALTLPFLVLCPEQFLYGIIGVHVSAGAGSIYHFGLMNKLGAISQLARYNSLLLLITFPVLLTLLFRKTRRTVFLDPREWVLWIGLGLVSLAHFLANWCHASYQVPVIPLWIMLASVGFARYVHSFQYSFIKKAFGLALLMGGLLSVIGYSHNFIWFDGHTPASPFLEDVALEVRKYTQPDARIITDQPLIAHQAKRQLLHGFEGAPFTYTPFWTTERCRLFSTVNDAMLAEMLSNQEADMIVIGPEAFRMASPGFVIVDQSRFDQTWALINRYYQQVSKIANFAGTKEPITLYRPRFEEPTSKP